MSGSAFLSYGTSYFDLLSQRIDDNEAEITDVDFAKLNKPDPIIPNGLLYVSDFDGNTASSTILCQNNEALQAVKCLQLKTSTANPATQIPELSGQSDSTVWLSSANGHLYRGAVDLEITGSGDVSSSTLSVDNAITRFDGTTGKIIQSSLVSIGDTGIMTLPSIKYPIVNTDQIIVGLDRVAKYLGYGRNGNKPNAVMIGIVSGSDSNTVSDTVIIGNNSCTIGSGNQVDVVAVGNDIGTASGSRCVILGNRISAQPSAISSLGSSNLAVGHDIDLRNGSLSNIVFGNSAKVNGTSNVLMGEKIFNTGCVSNSNTLIGYGIGEKIASSQSANNNVLIGTSVLALAANSCSSNILIGGNVGSTITSSVNNCIWLEETGEDGETNTIRIGKAAKTSCYVAGIYPSFTPSNTQKNVKINSDGRLVATNETRAFGSHSISGSNIAAVLIPAYSAATVVPGSSKLVMGGAPTSVFSTGGVFTAGTTVGSFRYNGSAPITVKYTLTIALTYSSTTGSNALLNMFMLKNNVFVPNTLCVGNFLLSNTSSPDFIITLVPNDVIEVGYNTLGAGTGSINVFTETRFIEVIA